nr:unnamed protein product [Callosobruchus chinensis]
MQLGYLLRNKIIIL